MDPSSNISPTSKRIIPILLAIGIFMQMLDTTILNTALPSIAADLGESPLRMQSIIISYTLVLALCAPISGVLADKFGTQRIFVLAIVLFTLGSLLCALSSTLLSLTMSRVIQGMGAAILSPVARLALMKGYKRSEYLSVLNYAITPALLGPIMGPVVGGYLVELASWHWIFLINLPFGIICIILGLKFMPNFKERSTYFDGRGYLMFTAGIFLITLGLELFNNHDYRFYALFIIAIGLIVFSLYWLYAKEVSHPLFPWKLFDIRTFRIGLRGNLIARLGITSVPFILPLFLQVSLGYTPSESGWMLVPIALSGIMIKAHVTKIIRYFGYRQVLIWNTLFISLSIISIGIFGTIISKYGLMLILFIMGFCNSIQFSAMNTLTISKLRPDQTSSGNSLMVVNQQIAMTIGVAMAALFLNFFTSRDWPIISSNAVGFQLTFITIGAITFLASFIFAGLHLKDGDNLANR